MSPVKVTLTNVANRLEWKGNKFTVDTAATTDSLVELWEMLKEIDPEFSLSYTDKIQCKKLPSLLQTFLKNCCYERHYFFDIKKCGEASCSAPCVSLLAYLLKNLLS